MRTQSGATSRKPKCLCTGHILRSPRVTDVCPAVRSPCAIVKVGESPLPHHPIEEVIADPEGSQADCISLNLGYLGNLVRYRHQIVLYLPWRCWSGKVERFVQNSWGSRNTSTHMSRPNRIESCRSRFKGRIKTRTSGDRPPAGYALPTRAERRD